jgi:hypothetical protein
MADKHVLKIDGLGRESRANEFKEKFAEPVSNFLTDLSNVKIEGEECPFVFCGKFDNMTAYIQANSADEITLGDLITTLIQASRFNPVIIAETILFTSRTKQEQDKILKERDLNKRRKMVFDLVMKDKF